MSEPTKQRPGDQPLPTGGGVCVQDVIIANMQESKRVGLERYGSTLQTFNGRRGIVDVHEEARDLYVYLTQVITEAASDREQVVDIVDEVLAPHYSGRRPATSRWLAEKIMETLEGWIVTQSTPKAYHATCDAGGCDGDTIATVEERPGVWLPVCMKHLFEHVRNLAAQPYSSDEDDED